MAPLPVIANVFRCAFHWSVPADQQDAENVMHFLGVGKTAGDVATALDAHISAHMFNSIAPSAAATVVSITPLDGTTATTDHALTHWVGQAGTGEYLPAVAVLLKFQTDLRGRSHRGRAYLPFTSETQASDGFLISGSQTLMTTEWNAWLTAMITDLVVPVVASYKLASSEHIVNILAEGPLGTQRRRQSRLRGA